MTKIAVVAGGVIDNFHRQFDFFVGVDRGALFLVEQGLAVRLAVGDFDSVSIKELALLKGKVEELVQAPAEKDDTDLELAVQLTLAHYPEAELTIFGAFGGRLDHTLANIFLPSNEKISPYLQQLYLVNQQNILCYFPSGRHRILPKEDMDYVAFMTTEDCPLTIEGAKYPLNESSFFFKKVYASNEFIGKPISFSVEKGYVVVIYSKDKERWME